MHLLGHWLGLDDPGGPVYLAWSGVVGQVAIVGGLVTLVRRHNCHEPRCWRIGHVTIDDRGTLSCWHHSPYGKPRRGHILRQHHRYLDRQASHG